MAAMTGRQQAHVLYRRYLHQARLFAHIWRDPVLYASHRTIARKLAEDIRAEQIKLHNLDRAARSQKANIEDAKRRLSRHGRPSNLIYKFEQPEVYALSRKEKVLKRLLDRMNDDLKHLAAANVGWPHAVERALDEGYARRGVLRHMLLAVSGMNAALMRSDFEAHHLLPPFLRSARNGQPFLPKHDVKTGRLKASPRTGKSPAQLKEALPRRQQSPLVSRSLRSLILSAAAHNGAPPPVSQFDLPPKLVVAMQKKSGLFPSQNEAVAALAGIERNLQAVGITRKREANARWRWLTSHLNKIQVPFEMEIVEDAEGQELEVQGGTRAAPDHQVGLIEARVMDRQPTIPKRMLRAMEEDGAPRDVLQQAKSASGSKLIPSPPYLQSARRLAAERGRGKEEETSGIAEAPFVHGKFERRPPKLPTPDAKLNYNLVKHGGWARSGPVDFERDHRARRRMWADLLARIPQAVYPSSDAYGQAKGNGKDKQGTTPKKQADMEEEVQPFGVEVSEADVALLIPEGAEEDDDQPAGDSLTQEHNAKHKQDGLLRRAILPTLQARSSTFQLRPAREWKFWVDYSLESSEPATGLSAEEAAEVNDSHERSQDGEKVTGEGSSTQSSGQRGADKDEEKVSGEDAGKVIAEDEDEAWMRRATALRLEAQRRRANPTRRDRTRVDQSAAPLKRSELALSGHNSHVGKQAKLDSQKFVRPDELQWVD
ncbi:hypothetical protein OC844_002685 [Tilletia horrida]|nr:hypothetical protein OC844_002685 [Tilletia horrida]